MEQEQSNPSVDLTQIHMYYMNLISDLKIRFAEEKGYMQSQIDSLEKNMQSSNSKLNTANQKLETIVQKTEQMKSSFEFDKFLWESKTSAVEKLLDIANKDINELQEKLKQITDAKNTDITVKDITTKRKHDKKDKEEDKEEDNARCKQTKYTDSKQKRILCYRFSKCNFPECSYGHSVDELCICPFGEYCDRKFCHYMFHSEENKKKFIEHNNKYIKVLCKDYFKNGFCIDKFCNKIHYYMADHDY